MKVSTQGTLLALWAIATTSTVYGAILGIDLGSLYMKVALVKRGAPLEIVTNLHSKRKTEQMILFDQGTRFYGADASSLLARKPTKTPGGFTVMLGRDEEHPAVKVLSQRHFPLTPSYNETRKGMNLEIDGGKESYTPEELVAMVLGHAKEITNAYGEEKGTTLGNIRDCVLTVPSFATQVERQALMDAAELADLNVLSLIDENTASALNFGMDKMYDDAQIIIFYNLGASSLQVSVIKFHTYEIPEGKYSKKTKKVGSIEVLGKAWDMTLGGMEFDNRLVDYMASHFNHEWQKARGHKKDIRDVPRAMTKIRLQANKVKHVLSANAEIPIHMDAVYDDMNLSMHITREQFEELCADLFERSVVPVTDALKIANVTLEEVNAIELIGGGMRVPKIQAELSKALNDMEMGLHINSDESMALGASFFGANISTAFKVRHVGLTDINPFPIAISLSNLPAEDAKKDKKKKKGEEEEEWGKSATVFKANGKIGIKKTIAFTHDKDVHCTIDYEDAENFPEGTQKPLQRYNISGVEEFAKEMEEKGLGSPKVSLQFELSSSGICQLIKAEAAVEETYTVEEEEEVDDDEAEEPTEEEKKEEEAKDDEESKEGEEEKKEDEKPKKKKKTIKVEKEKKRTLKKTLDVKVYSVGKNQHYSPELLAESKAKMAELQRKDEERIALEAAKNKVESYIYYIKNKLVDDEENVALVSTEEQRESLRELANEAEDWLYDDGASADLSTMEEKYTELSTPAEKIWFRLKESTERPEAIKAVKAKMDKVEELLKKWEESKPQVTEEERGEVMEKVEKVRSWVEEKEAAQAALKGHEDPAFTSEEVPLQTKPVEMIVAKLSRKPAPKPEKKEEEKAEETEGEGEGGASEGEESQEGSESDEESKEESSESESEETKDGEEL